MSSSRRDFTVATIPREYSYNRLTGPTGREGGGGVQLVGNVFIMCLRETVCLSSESSVSTMMVAVQRR